MNKPYNKQTGRWIKKFTDEHIIEAVADCNGMMIGDIAKHLGAKPHSIVKHLNRLANDGVLEYRLVANGTRRLWYVVDNGCFKQFDPTSVQCKCCNVAVECYEASER